MSNISLGKAQARLLVIPACLAFTSLTAISIASPAYAQVSIDISATVAPPPLVEYDQPPLPAPGYIWTPGYWLYGDAGYYWVPGTWVEPPSVGLLWTPGYWGYDGGRYVFNAGYWGPHVGFYGGVDYGFGYGGEGYEGGFWRGGQFSYNRAVNNFGGVHVTNVYNKTVVRNVTVNRVSFNGPGGIDRRPTPAEQTYARESHVHPTELQVQHREMAAKNPELRDSVNHGHPAITATSKPGEMANTGRAAEEKPAAREGENHPAEMSKRDNARPGTERRPEGEAAAPGRKEPENHMAAPGREPEASHAPEMRSPATAEHTRAPEPGHEATHATGMAHAPAAHEAPHAETPHADTPHAETPHAEAPHATEHAMAAPHIDHAEHAEHAAAAPHAEHAVAQRERPHAAPAAMHRAEPARPEAAPHPAAHAPAAHAPAAHDDKAKR